MGFRRLYRGKFRPGRSKEEDKAPAFLLEKAAELLLMTTGLQVVTR
jgi:hypothetical protein